MCRQETEAAPPKPSLWRYLYWRGLAPALVLMASCLLAQDAVAAERYEARAYARGGEGTLLYTETHWRYQQSEERGVWQHLVLYGCPNGVPFARKRLRESPSAQAPDFEFHDARDGYREGVRSLGKGGAREVYVQQGAGAALEAKPLKLPAGGVIDAGFDSFVRQHWRALSGGSALTVPFLVPSRFEALDFKIDDARDGEVEGVPVRKLRMKLSAWFGFIVPAIELAYTRDGSRLVAFQGMGTVRDERGRHQEVFIHFPAQARTNSAPQAEIDAALTATLSGNCSQTRKSEDLASKASSAA